MFLAQIFTNCTFDRFIIVLNGGYNEETQILNAKDYGISQSRPRAIIKMYKKLKQTRT